VLAGVQYVQQVLFEIKASRKATQDAVRLVQSQSQQEQLKSETAERRQQERMQQFLDSGDPILMAEAIVWMQSIHPLG